MAALISGIAISSQMPLSNPLAGANSTAASGAAVGSVRNASTGRPL